MSDGFQVPGESDTAPFKLKLHRGDGMALIAMDWRNGRPPENFVGFAIEYRQPNSQKFFPLTNRLSFEGPEGTVSRERRSTLLAPIQKFRWVHFPMNANLEGPFRYRVTPVFMDDADKLSYGEAQHASIELRRDTHPGKINVAFTRGFVSSQAFVDNFAPEGDKDVAKLLPKTADEGLTFDPHPPHPNAAKALAWMGFEAREAILALLDEAIADKEAQVRVVAYDLNEPRMVSRLEQLGDRLKVIIDDEGGHGAAGSAEGEAAKKLERSAGQANVKRQHMGQLQHNKTIVVDGPEMQAAVCGSTNFSWRGFFVQSNNAVVFRGEAAVKPFLAAFQAYWDNDEPRGFGRTESAQFMKLELGDVDVTLGFAPYASRNAMLAKVAGDIADHTESSLFYSLAFLYQTPGAIRDAIKKVTDDEDIFVYGISDRRVGGVNLQKPNGERAQVQPEALGKKAPEPFKSEPVGGGGNRMHHKFVVIDFDLPTGRVYLGSYNFSKTADRKNGENLLLIRDRRIAVSYAVEALRILDHYHFRVLAAERSSEKLVLRHPPRKPGEKPWWEEDYTDPVKIRDRELFAKEDS